LIPVGHLLLDEVWGTLGRLGDLGLDGALVAEPSEAAHEQASSYGGAKLALLVQDVCVEDEKTSLAFILEISDLLLDDVLLAGDKWLLERDLLLTMQEHHRVEGGDAWDVKVAISEGTSVADREGIGGERLEVLGILVAELEMIRVHRILLEADAKSIQDGIACLELDLIRLLLEAECLLHINLWFRFGHIYQC